MELTKSDFESWKSHPAGREVFKMLRERMDNLTLLGFSEGALRDPIYGAIQLGRKLEIEDLLEMTFEELMGYEQSESDGNKASRV